MLKWIFIFCLVSTGFLLPLRLVFAADMTLPTTATVTAQQDSDYTLPYPGLLPDNPFYGLKMLRDRIVGSLITNPQKKAEFDLLQADKRLQGGVYLLHKDRTKANLALSTISKGQQYFDDAFTALQKAQQQNYAVAELQGRFLLAAQKHQEVIGTLKAEIPPSEKGFYNAIRKKADSLEIEARAVSSH